MSLKARKEKVDMHVFLFLLQPFLTDLQLKPKITTSLHQSMSDQNRKYTANYSLFINKAENTTSLRPSISDYI